MWHVRVWQQPGAQPAVRPKGRPLLAVLLLLRCKLASEPGHHANDGMPHGPTLLCHHPFMPGRRPQAAQLHSMQMWAVAEGAPVVPSEMIYVLGLEAKQDR